VEGNCRALIGLPACNVAKSNNLLPAGFFDANQPRPKWINDECTQPNPAD
jgi:hypothetical protein